MNPPLHKQQKQRPFFFPRPAWSGHGNALFPFSPGGLFSPPVFAFGKIALCSEGRVSLAGPPFFPASRCLGWIPPLFFSLFPGVSPPRGVPLMVFFFFTASAFGSRAADAGTGHNTPAEPLPTKESRYLRVLGSFFSLGRGGDLFFFSPPRKALPFPSPCTLRGFTGGNISGSSPRRRRAPFFFPPVAATPCFFPPSLSRNRLPPPDGVGRPVIFFSARHKSSRSFFVSRPGRSRSFFFPSGRPPFFSFLTLLPVFPSPARARCWTLPLFPFPASCEFFPFFLVAGIFRRPWHDFPFLPLRTPFPSPHLRQHPNPFSFSRTPPLPLTRGRRLLAVVFLPPGVSSRPWPALLPSPTLSSLRRP